MARRVRLNELKEAAIDLAKMGFYVFPVVYEEKKPFMSGWRDISTCDIDIIDTIWNNVFNIGVDCGKSNLVVIDIDVCGINAWTKLGIFETTLVAQTPSGGMHIYYTYDHKKSPLSNTVGKIGEGIDTRGWGGFVLAPPSKTTRCYRWLVSASPQKLPPEIITILEKRRTFVSQGGTCELGDLLDRIRNAQVGTRNNTLNLCAFIAGKRIYNGELDYNFAFNALLEAALASGLGEKESVRTILSAFDGAKRSKK